MVSRRKPKRELIAAFGVELTGKDFVSPILERYLDDLVKRGQATRTRPEFEYEYVTPKWTYVIRIVFSKQEFLEAIDTPNAIVIYIGHARWGQGPVFDPLRSITQNNKCPDKELYRGVNPWENHVRMGWDVASTACIEDILEHCTNPKSFTELIAPFFTYYEHDKRFREAKKSKKSLHKPLPKEVADRENEMGGKTLRGRHYWTTGRSTDGKLDYMTFVVAGNDDLRRLNLSCSALFICSCSSLPRYYCALLNRKLDTNSECVFYLTEQTSYPTVSQAVNNFVFLVLEMGYEPTHKLDGRIIQDYINMQDAVTRKHFPKIDRASGIVRYLPGLKLSCRRWKTKA